MAEGQGEKGVSGDTVLINFGNPLSVTLIYRERPRKNNMDVLWQLPPRLDIPDPHTTCLVANLVVSIERRNFSSTWIGELDLSEDTGSFLSLKW